jgi:NADH-quinone oxidoreductase subunit K
MIEIALAAATLLFFAGLALILLRRSLIVWLLGAELLFNAALLVALAGAARWHSPSGQVLALFLMALSGAALAPSLALLLRVRRELGTLGVDGLRLLREREAQDG